MRNSKNQTEQCTPLIIFKNKIVCYPTVNKPVSWVLKGTTIIKCNVSYIDAAARSLSGIHLNVRQHLRAKD